MTQLDNITWFPQIIWLFIIFVSIYSLTYKSFGPLSFFNQSLRSGKIEHHYLSLTSYEYLNIESLFKRFNIINANF